MKRDKTNKAFWQKFAFLYAPFMRKNRRQYAEVYSCCSKYITSDMRVLELACGTGQFSSLLAADVKALTATDFSEKMVARARKRVRANNVVFSVRDATRLPYRAQSFDAVFIANALHIMPYPDKALSEIYRVLKSGGMLFAPTFVYDEGKSKRVGVIEKIGFKTFNKWESKEFSEYISRQGFIVKESRVLPGKTAPECVLTAKKEAAQGDR